MILSVLRFYSAQRSGHHAILNWIVKQIPGQVVHINNLQTEVGQSYIFTDEGFTEGDATYYRTLDPPEVYNKERALTHVTYNFEDYASTIIENPLLKMPTPESWPTRDLLIIRDPLNLIASRVKAYYNSEAEGFINFEKIENYISWCMAVIHKSLPDTNFTVINYNSWFADPDYRSTLAETLEIPFSDLGIDEVPLSGQGSSFDRLRFNQKAQDMKVLERFMTMQEDPIFQAMVSKYSKEFKLISETLFSDTVNYRLNIDS